MDYAFLFLGAQHKIAVGLQNNQITLIREVVQPHISLSLSLKM